MNLYLINNKYTKMINIVKRKKFTSDNSSQICNDIQYFGKDVLKANIDYEIKELVKSSINKDCVTYNGEKGIIIGFEDCNSLIDYYFIVYCPNTKETVYELVNDPDFIKTIQ